MDLFTFIMGVRPIKTTMRGVLGHIIVSLADF